jgi:FdhD protein
MLAPKLKKSLPAKIRNEARPGKLSSKAPSSSAATRQSATTQVVRIRPRLNSYTDLDSVAREEPLEIRIRGRSVAVTMRTPGHDGELAAGFLLSEGLIGKRGDLIEISPCKTAEVPENVLNVFLAPGVEVDFGRLTRHVFASSSCGLCGKASIDEVHQHFPPIVSKAKVAPKILVTLPGRMQSAQRTFARTGGLHAAAVFDLQGKLLVLREDIGRHNAVDKVLGWGFLQDRMPLDGHILLVSGRASFEIVQKALAARIPIIAAVSAPSSLAVEFARENGQTLIGFLRGKTMNVYAGAAVALGDALL